MVRTGICSVHLSNELKLVVIRQRARHSATEFCFVNTKKFEGLHIFDSNSTYFSKKSVYIYMKKSYKIALRWGYVALIILIGITFVVMVRTALDVSPAKEPTDLATLQIIVQDVPLTSAPANVKGIIEPGLASILTDKETSLDISGLCEGYIFVNYTGTRESAMLHVYYEQEDTPSRYKYETGAGWQGYALPRGSGAYRIDLSAFDEIDRTSTADDISVFVLQAEFDDAAPYRYENAYVDYDADSPLVLGAAYLVEEAETESQRALTDREKTELIVHFVSHNIETDRELLNKIDSDQYFSYFPRADEVFDTGKGVCGERAILASAMLKSLGLPVKIYHGDIFMPQNREGKKYGYHAWIGVYLDGEWAMYDPTATHNTEIIDGKSITGTEYLLNTVTMH
jgi:hypothetical protein